MVIKIMIEYFLPLNKTIVLNINSKNKNSRLLLEQLLVPELPQKIPA